MQIFNIGKFIILDITDALRARYLAFYFLYLLKYFYTINVILLLICY